MASPREVLDRDPASAPRYRSAAITQGRLLATLRVAADVLALAALFWVAVHVGNIAPPGDAISYYEARGEHLYGHTLGLPGYAYSPAFAQVISPLQDLPFPTFRAIIAGAELLGLAYLFGPVLALVIVVLQVYPVWESILLSGNLQILAAASLVLALRHPTAWPLVLLVKLTPGIGILWPALRREWRSLAIGVGLTLAIAAASFAIDPHHWFEWVTWMSSSVDASPDRAGLPLPVRFLIAVGLLVYAARADRIWLVPVAAAIASPEGGIHWLLLLGVYPLWRSSRSRGPTAPSPATMHSTPTGAQAGVESPR